MVRKIIILVGTMTGNAELVAQELELRFDAEEIDVTIKDMNNVAPEIFCEPAIFLVSTSTYGQGDVPDNAKDLYNALESSKPDLSGVHYGVIALGDRTYSETYCFGGKKFDKILQSCGATRIGDVMMHDASLGTLPEEDAGDWSIAWLAECDPLWS